MEFDGTDALIALSLIAWGSLMYWIFWDDVDEG